MQNISNAPVTPNVDVGETMVELYDSSGTGFCHHGPTRPCTGAGNTQTCKV